MNIVELLNGHGSIVPRRQPVGRSGVKDEQIHFLDLPFYETGRVRKKPISEDDIKITTDLLERIKPHQIYAAGDLSDPHGTHRVCLTAIFQSFGAAGAE